MTVFSTHGGFIVFRLFLAFPRLSLVPPSEASISFALARVTTAAAASVVNRRGVSADFDSSLVITFCTQNLLAERITALNEALHHRQNYSKADPGGARLPLEAQEERPAAKCHAKGELWETCRKDSKDKGQRFEWVSFLLGASIVFVRTTS